MVWIPINPNMPEEVISHIISDSEVDAFIFEDNYSALVDSIRPQLGTVRNFLVIGRSPNEGRSYEELLSSYPSDEPRIEVSEDNLCAICYSSGTTGLPKGIMLTHKNLFSQMLHTISAWHMRPDDVLLMLFGYQHCVLVEVGLALSHVGGTNVTTGDNFAPELILENIAREKVTILFGPPNLTVPPLDHPNAGGYDLSSLRLMIHAAATLPVEVLKNLIANYGNIFGQSYGSQEQGLTVFHSLEEAVIGRAEEPRETASSVGKGVVKGEVRVVNEEGGDVNPGEIGEIITRGDHVMKGYWKLPEVTMEAMRGGYYYTGDLATVDEEGYIYLTGRKKDVIVSGEKKIYPEEVEEVIYRHQSILEAAVIGVPDAELGESLKAIVVLREGKRATAEEIIKLCAQSLATYAVPGAVEFVNRLPRNPTGKVLKRELRERYSSR